MAGGRDNQSACSRSDSLTNGRGQSARGLYFVTLKEYQDLREEGVPLFHSIAESCVQSALRTKQRAAAYRLPHLPLGTFFSIEMDALLK